MTMDYWTAAFTIVVGGIQVDFTELSDQDRIQILRSLFAGETMGKRFPDKPASPCAI